LITVNTIGDTWTVPIQFIHTCPHCCCCWLLKDRALPCNKWTSTSKLKHL
jgi:hypothetical protein